MSRPTKVQIVSLGPTPIVMLAHQGPYEEIGPVFDRLFDWVKAYQVPALRTIGAYWDNPDHVPASRLRSAACVEVPEGYLIANGGGLPLKLTQLVAGDYATTQFVGPYDELAAVWRSLTDTVENALGHVVSDSPAFEVYVNNPEDVPSSQLITNLYLPIA